MVSLVSRTGRNLQRYREGRRIVVGCVPYRYKNGKHPSCENTNTIDDEGELEILVISSQKGGHCKLFPKGGWESDESIEEAAERETEEEAGVRGKVQRKLGEWPFKSKRYNTTYEGIMYPLLVKEELDQWPEKNHRLREWRTVAGAREVCQHHWMKAALDRLVKRLMQQPEEEDIVRSTSNSSYEETTSEEEIAPSTLEKVREKEGKNDKEMEEISLPLGKNYPPHFLHARRLCKPEPEQRLVYRSITLDQERQRDLEI